MDKLKKVLLWLWQLPQNILGLLPLLINRGEVKHRLDNIVFYYDNNFPGGITLGEYILVGSETAVRHEFGHVLQSRILGPLYLFVIGIPSIVHAAINEYIGCCKKHKEGYYHFYTEKWANKLGKVNN